MSPPLNIDPIAEARRHWEERWGDEPARPMAAVTSVMRAQQVLLARLNELLAPLGLTFPRYEALMLLSFTRTGALPLGKVGERLQVHRTSVTNIIDKLEKDELVRRVPHEADRRTTLAEITDAGREVAARATTLLNDDAFGLAALDDSEQEQLTELLRTLRIEAGDFEEAQKPGVTVRLAEDRRSEEVGGVVRDRRVARAPMHGRARGWRGPVASPSEPRSSIARFAAARVPR